MRVFVVSMLLVFGFPFIMTDVVDSFETCKQFFLKEPPMISGILEKSVSKNQNVYRIICQKYKNIFRYATLYDITNKIPLFSAYKYTGHHTGKRPKSKWRTEPQLEDSNAGMSQGCSNQACNGDYLNNQMNVSRGHLFPCCHAADEDTAESTFTLTNIVPQSIIFNSGSWSRMEQKVREIMNSHCRDEKNREEVSAYVLTGAVPNTKKPSADVLNNRVNIPSHMWTVFCCFNSKSNKYVSQAHWAENIDEDTNDISVKTLKELQDFLKSIYNKETSLFNGDCLDPLKADASPPPNTDACDEPDVKKQSWWSTNKIFGTFWDFWAWLRGYF
ncbi:endonuclease domain-containing 1 protein-like [Rhinichthys klamathensis goyatoka]|uniref:endonuclease domain-containing 1 protein-like n=1 Tax=Rhinichthys klamathensis goyatoka TaxID=3034132 RepID=UPI0024B4908B|nr:endonuclease domain-containing 1 protein-like [Rhinichthys klamathensis goyatoka]